MMKKLLSLRKSKHVLKTAYESYKKQGKSLSPESLSNIEQTMEACDQAILKKDREEASRLASKIEVFGKENFKRPWTGYVFEFVLAIIFALIIATVVRQMWFELYEIPTGSMRPTFREKDNLTVTKTAFGLNVPLKTEHFYFNPELVQRTSVLIFSGDNIDLPETDTTYFGIFPYKKRYIKRLIGKPGDSLYFYGGKLYVVDKEGLPVKEFIDAPWMQKLEHIPFISFEGKRNSGMKQITFSQFHKPLGRISLSSSGELQGEIFNGKDWVKDQVQAAKDTHREIQTYSDFFGMRNFAKARIITKNELKKRTRSDPILQETAPLYLELSHTPNLSNPKPVDDPDLGMMLQPFVTWIPLQEKNLNAIMDAMYTARFVVKDGKAQRYSAGGTRPNPNLPRFPGVPDGTYEFYYGKASQIGLGGVSYALPDNHPLYRRDPANIQRLFNMGIDMNTWFDPSNGKDLLFPNRYAYFRNGDLYLMGAPILSKDDPVLEKFNKDEARREQQSTQARPYIAFKDHGAPAKEDGSYDVEFIRTVGR